MNFFSKISLITLASLTLALPAMAQERWHGGDYRGNFPGHVERWHGGDRGYYRDRWVNRNYVTPYIYNPPIYYNYPPPPAYYAPPPAYYPPAPLIQAPGFSFWIN